MSRASTPSHRVAALRRTLATTGYVKQYRIRTTADGIEGEIVAPARLLNQSLVPVLNLRGFDVDFTLAPGDAPDTVVEATITDAR